MGAIMSHNYDDHAESLESQLLRFQTTTSMFANMSPRPSTSLSCRVYSVDRSQNARSALVKPANADLRRLHQSRRVEITLYYW